MFSFIYLDQSIEPNLFHPQPHTHLIGSERRCHAGTGHTRCSGPHTPSSLDPVLQQRGVTPLFLPLISLASFTPGTERRLYEALLETLQRTQVSLSAVPRLMESSASSEPTPASARPRGLRSVQQALELGQLAGTVAAVGVKEVEVELRGMINNVRHLGGKRGVTTAEYITSIHKHKTHVGSTFIHEKHGTGKLAEITANGDFVMQFDSGDVHTYQPKSIYKLRPVSEAQLKKMKAGASKGGKMAGSKMFNDLQERMELYRTLMSGHPVQVDLDATVEEVVDASKVLGKSAPGGADEEHAIWQAGVLVNKHKWSTLQYHCHPRLGTVTVRLKVEKWGETDIVMFMCRHARTCAPQLLHGGVGAVGNYRDDKAAKKGDKGKKGEKPLAWLLSNADGTDRRFREYFIQSSHNSYILGRQVRGRARPVPRAPCPARRAPRPASRRAAVTPCFVTSCLVTSCRSSKSMARGGGP